MFYFAACPTPSARLDAIGWTNLSLGSVMGSTCSLTPGRRGSATPVSCIAILTSSSFECGGIEFRRSGTSTSVTHLLCQGTPTGIDRLFIRSSFSSDCSSRGGIHCLAGPVIIKTVAVWTGIEPRAPDCNVSRAHRSQPDVVCCRDRRHQLPSADR